jgi:hypothetical protein
MRKLIGVVLFLCLVSLMAAAQETGGKAQIFGGYQYTRLGSDVTGGLTAVNANGFNGAASINLNRWFGAVADFSGAYASPSGVSTKLYTYTFGPQISMHSGALTPFAHFLIGGMHASASTSSGGVTTSASSSGMAMMFGGGVDVGKHNLALRLAQFDWLSLHNSGTSYNNNMRLSTGLVMRF